MLNPYFQHFSYKREQDLVENLIIESIQIYGHDIQYLPRTIVNKDNLFGEDVLSKFDQAIPIEIYIKNVEGFEGEGDFLSKFNLEIRDQITFTMAQRRFDTIDNDWSLNQGRPLEGDLIYFPLVGKIFEIKFVEHEQIFYQTGKLQIYDLSCELFEYSSERIDTGDFEIDTIENEHTHDILNYEFTLEDDSGVLLLESGGSILQEYRIEDTDTSANNEYYTSEAADFVDFSEINPFSEVDRY